MRWPQFFILCILENTTPHDISKFEEFFVTQLWDILKESPLKSSFQAFHWTHADAQIALLVR